MMANMNRPATVMLSKAAAVIAFDEIVTGLRNPPSVSAEAHEIAAQLRALAETVQAGRDEWVVATVQRAQRLSASVQRRSFWR
jgi:hypothetical protein